MTFETANNQDLHNCNVVVFYVPKSLRSCVKNKHFTCFIRETTPEIRQQVKSPTRKTHNSGCLVTTGQQLIIRTIKATALTTTRITILIILTTIITAITTTIKTTILTTITLIIMIIITTTIVKTIIITTILKQL